MELFPRLILFFAAALSTSTLCARSNAPRPPRVEKKERYVGNTAPVLDRARVEDHVIAADNDGWPMRASYDFERGKAAAKRCTGEEADAYFDNIIEKIKRQPRGTDGKKHILIFIHGGMNKRNGAIAHAARLMNNKDTSLTDEYYPIFVTWNSDPFSCWAEHLFSVRNGSSRPGTAWMSAPFYLATDVARGVTRLPAVGGTMLGRLQHKTLQHAIVAHEVYKVAGTPEVTHDTYRQLELSDGRTEAKNMVHWSLFPTKAVGLFVLDTIGTGAWNMMLRRANLLFDCQERSSYLGEVATHKRDLLIDKVEKQTEPGAETGAAEEAKWFLDHREIAYPSRSLPGVVERFLQRLERNTTNSKAVPDHYSITVVGHSMGAIVANEMIKRHHELPFDTILYMAGACSLKECRDAVSPYLADRLRRGERAEFYSLSLHPTAERAEASFSPDPLTEEEKLAPPLKRTGKELTRAGQALLSYTLVPRGSLLEWLDEFFATPVNIENRRLGKWETALTTVNSFPENVRKCVHLKMFPRGEGAALLEAGNPQKHGQFSRMKFWERDFKDPRHTVLVEPKTDRN